MVTKKLLIIKQLGCMPCEVMQPKAIELANKYNIGHGIIDRREIEESIRPAFTPYFFLLDPQGVKIAEWGGALEKIDKLEQMIKENI